MKSDTTHQFRLGSISSPDELEELWAIDNSAYGAASIPCRPNAHVGISPRVNSPKNDDPSLWESLHAQTQTTADALELLRE